MTIPAHITETFTHARQCTGPALTPDKSPTGRLDLHCAGCGRRMKLSRNWQRIVGECFGVDAAETAEPEPVDQTEEPEPVVTDPRVITWWCREHDRRVSHHGRDCPKCRAEHAQREAGRRRTRRAQTD